MQLYVHVQAHTQVSLYVQFIAHANSLFLRFALLLLYISHSVKFFIEDYIQEI